MATLNATNKVQAAFNSKPPDLINSAKDGYKAFETIFVNNNKDVMQYYKLEANVIYSCILRRYTPNSAFGDNQNKCEYICGQKMEDFYNGNFEEELNDDDDDDDYNSALFTKLSDSSISDMISPYGNLSNNNFTGTTAVNIIFNNEEAYQMYNLKQMTYGKKFVSNYMMKTKKFPEISHLKAKPVKEKKIKKGKLKENTFLRAIESIPKVHRPVFDPPCPWLEKRLYVDDLSEHDTTWEDIAVAIRENLINLANDLCIFYTSQSHFLFTIIKVEAYNLMRMLSLPAIQEYNNRLSATLLKNLLILINQDLEDNFMTFQDMRDLSKDLIWNYYRYPNPHAVSLKHQMKDRPRILYYSIWLNDELIPGIRKRKIDYRFVRIERNFHCKVILRRNLAALSTQVETRINETLFEVYFDYNRGRFPLAISNINKIIRRNESRLYHDLTCYQCMVSCVSKEFFCCEEVSSLVEREYVMDDMSYQFIQLMHWLKSQRVGHYAL